MTIIGAHAWSFPIFWTGGLTSEGIRQLFIVTETLFHGSTLYFAIISGVLFSKVLSTSPWQRFYVSKCKYVIAPYICMTVAMTALYWPFIVENTASEGSQPQFIAVVFNHLLNANAVAHLWYIPILLGLFALTPLLWWLVRTHVFIACVIGLLPLICSRTTFPDFLSWQTLVFFTGAYMAGMLYGENEDYLVDKIRQHAWLIVFAVVGATSCIYLLYLFDYQSGEITSWQQSLFYVQKLLVAALLLVALRDFKSNKILSILADYSFAIYFIHLAVIGFLIIYVYPLSEPRNVFALFGVGLANFLIPIAVSIAITKLLRFITAGRSRMIVGS